MTPDYKKALAEYQHLDDKGRAIVEQHMSLLQAQGKNPLEWLQKTMQPHTWNRVANPNGTAGVRG